MSARRVVKRRFGVLPVIPLVMLAWLTIGWPAGVCRGITAWKDPANPTGIPDVYQGRTAHCAAATWADAIWWYNQHHAGLVNTQAEGWYKRSQDLFGALEKRIYDQRRGHQGVLLYIHEKRPQDFSVANDPARKKRRRIESTWGVQHHNWQGTRGGGGTDLEAEAQASLTSDHKFTVLGVFLHETSDATNDFKVPLQGGKEGLWSHRMAYAGRDQDAAGALTHLRLSHGWGPDHKSEPAPVSSTYYDQYTVSVVETSIPKYHKNNLRITDAAFYGRAGGLAANAQIDYAAVTTMSTLRDDFKTFYGLDYFNDPTKKGGGASSMSSRPADIVSRHVLENLGEGSITEWAFQLPLLDTVSLDWVSSVEMIDLPADWYWEPWDPNETEYMTPMIFADEDGLLERSYRGMRLFTETAPLMDGESLTLEFWIGQSFVDYLSASPMAYAIADPGRDYFAESLGLRIDPIPEPSTALGVILAVCGLARYVGRHRFAR